MKRIFIGLHIPKTAGGTLLEYLTGELGHYRFHQTTNLLRNANLDIPFLEEMTDTGGVDVVFGHHLNEEIVHLFPDRDIYLFTLIRDPVQRILSHFHFSNQLRQNQGFRPLEFGDFYKNTELNLICNWITGRFPGLLDDTHQDLPLHEKTVQILRQFSFVCATEEFDSHINILLQDIGIRLPDTAPVRSNVSSYEGREYECDLEQIRSDNREDVLLHEHFRNARKGSPDAANPLGFDPERLRLSLAGIVSQPYDRLDRLKYYYHLAALEYRNYGRLEREIARSRTRLADQLLKHEILCSRLRDTSGEDSRSLSTLRKILDDLKPA